MTPAPFVPTEYPIVSADRSAHSYTPVKDKVHCTTLSHSWLLHQLSFLIHQCTAGVTRGFSHPLQMAACTSNQGMRYHRQQRPTTWPSMERCTQALQVLSALSPSGRVRVGVGVGASGCRDRGMLLRQDRMQFVLVTINPIPALAG